jgi:hypothetical protein
LASTEVLLVNLWEHQIGLYQGANMGLLKTVFEVNLGLFGAGGDGSKARSVLYLGSRYTLTIVLQQATGEDSDLVRDS